MYTPTAIAIELAADRVFERRCAAVRRRRRLRPTVRQLPAPRRRAAAQVRAAAVD